MSQSNEIEKTADLSYDEQIMKLQDHLAHREKKLKEMSVILGELNNDLNEALEKHQHLLNERKVQIHKLERKNEQIVQERIDKNWIEEQMIKLERENIRLNQNFRKSQENIKNDISSNHYNPTTNITKSNIFSDFKEENEETDKGEYQPPSFD